VIGLVFAECVAEQKQAYRKRHPEWTPEQLDKVARAVCATIEKKVEKS